MHAVIHQCLIAIIEVGYGCILIIALGRDSRILAWVVRLTLPSESAAGRRWLVDLQGRLLAILSRG